MIKASYIGLFAIAAAVTLASQAKADDCFSPQVDIVNDRTATIKVTKIQYLDGCDSKWRTEDLAATEIAPGGSHTFTDNLEHVGNCPIKKFKIYRAVRQSTGSAYGSFEWGSEKVADQGTPACRTNVRYTIHAAE